MSSDGKQQVRIGIVGAGGIVRHRHLPGLKKIPGVEVLAVVNRSEESGRRVAEEWGIPDVLTDWRRLVSRDDLDAVLIGTWPYMHCQVTLAALAAGKHVFCQARMAMNLAEARRMLDAARASDRVTMLCPPPVGLKGDLLMQRLLAEKYVGRPRLVRLTSLNGSFADPGGPLLWRQDKRLSGENILALGIYVEVLHRWLGHVQQLSSVMSIFVTERPVVGSGEKVRVEIPDSLTVVGRMENGAELSIAMSGAVPHGPQDTLEIYGSEGSLLYNFAGDTIAGCRGDDRWHEIPITAKEARPWTVEEDFIAAIRTGCQVHPDFHDGLKYMEFVEAVWRSHAAKRQVTLPLAD